MRLGLLVIAMQIMRTNIRYLRSFLNIIRKSNNWFISFVP